MEIDHHEAEASNRKRSKKKRKSRKESKDSAISDVSTKLALSRETSIDSGAGVDVEDEESSHARLEDDTKTVQHVTSINKEDRRRLKSMSTFRRHGSESLILVDMKREAGEAAKLSSIKKHVNTDSPKSVASSASVLNLSPSPYAESRLLSSPSFSDRSTPHRSKSPELSKALRVKQERLQLELALAETRSKLKQHHIGEKPQSTEADSKKTRLSKKVLQRAKSLELSKLKYAEKISLLDKKANSQSLETIKAMEECYSHQKHRSKSEKRYVVSLGQDNQHLPKVGNARNLVDLPENSDLMNNERANQSTEFGSQSRLGGGSTLETARTSAVILNVSDSGTGLPSSRREIVLPHLPEQEVTRAELVKFQKINPIQENNSTSSNSSDQNRKLYTPSVAGHIPTDTSPSEGHREISDNLASQIEKKTLSTLTSILREDLPPIPSTEDSQEAAVLDWRPVFRAEMLRLRKEVNDFRQFCAKQVEQNALVLANQWNKSSEISSSHPKNGLPLSEELQDVDVNLQLLQRKQKVLDLEAELSSKEKQLSEKQKNLEEYEKEIKEVESLLNQRQAVCDRRQRALVNLDEELQQLRQELEQTRDQIHQDGTIPESNSERARRNWDMVRRNLLDRQHLLESTVQKYRGELAAATSTLAGKDILIARLQNTVVDNEEELANKDKRIKQLEAKLGLALSEARNLSEQLSNYSHREMLGSSIYGRRSSQELTPDQSRTSFRGSMYRRPSTFAGSDHSDEHPKPVITAALDHDSEQFRNNSRLLGKRSSISDNAITRLTLSTLKTDDKYGRGSSACAIQ
nr:pre-mRNA-splicing factor CWC22-like protein [Biomphalaria glabrata]